MKMFETQTLSLSSQFHGGRALQAMASFPQQHKTNFLRLVHKPHHKMGFNHWRQITDRNLDLPLNIFLSFFNNAASESDNSENLLDIRKL